MAFCIIVSDMIGTMYIDPLVTAYITVVAAILGLVMGSFINCWAWRSVNGESVTKGRSHCTSCGHALGGRDLIPVLSWVFSHGKCRYCGERVSARYLATELICGIAFALIALRYGFSIETIELLAFAGILLYLSLVDLDTYTIPNACIIAAIAIRVVFLLLAWLIYGIDIMALLVPSLIGAAALGIGVLVVALVMDRVLGRESMGGGDIKLFAVAGFYFGWQQGILLLILSCIIGIVMALLVKPPAAEGEETEDGSNNNDESTSVDNPSHENTSKTEGDSEQSKSAQTAESGSTGDIDNATPEDTESKPSRMRGRTIPFGPSIAVACVVIMLVGESIISWYIGLF